MLTVVGEGFDEEDDEDESSENLEPSTTQQPTLHPKPQLASSVTTIIETNSENLQEEEKKEDRLDVSQQERIDILQESP